MREKDVFSGKEEVWWAGSIIFVRDICAWWLTNAYTSNLKSLGGLVCPRMKHKV